MDKIKNLMFLSKGMSLFFLVMVLAPTSLMADYRTWTDVKGRKLVAKFQSSTETHVTLKLKKNHKSAKLEINLLSSDDQEFIKSKAEELEKQKMAAIEEAVTFDGRKLEAGKRHRFMMSGTVSKKEVEFEVGIIVPQEFDPLNKDYNVVVVYVPGAGNAIDGMHHYTEVLKVENTILLAFNLKGEGYGYMIEIIHNRLNEKWPRREKNHWKQVHFGYSGGAKNGTWGSGWFIKKGANVVGCYLSGCNEDLTERAKALLKKGSERKKLRKMAFFLSSGTKDDIAPPESNKRVIASLRKNKIKKIKMKSFDGGHVINRNDQVEALKWILEKSEE